MSGSELLHPLMRVGGAVFGTFFRLPRGVSRRLVATLDVCHHRLKRFAAGIVLARRPDRPAKPRLMVLISEDWFFCSHFMDRALAARAAGYDVAVMARERAHGEKIRAAGLTLLPVDFNRRSINPITELALLLRIWRIYRRERPDVVYHIAAKPILYGTLAAMASLRRPAIVNAPVGMGYVFSSRQQLARLATMPLESMGV